MENGPLKETRRAGGAGRACASSSAALALDVLQAGGEEKLAGVADPPRLLGFQQGVIYTPAALSSQQGHCKQPVGLAGAAATQHQARESPFREVLNPKPCSRCSQSRAD